KASAIANGARVTSTEGDSVIDQAEVPPASNGQPLKDGDDAGKTVESGLETGIDGKEEEKVQVQNAETQANSSSTQTAVAGFSGSISKNPFCKLGSKIAKALSKTTLKKRGLEKDISIKGKGTEESVHFEEESLEYFENIGFFARTKEHLPTLFEESESSVD